MLNYTKAPDLSDLSDVSLDFQVAVSGTRVEVVSPRIGMKINFKATTERDTILERAANAAYHHCMKNNIPVDGNSFVVLNCDKGVEKGGNFKGMFVPHPAFHH